MMFLQLLAIYQVGNVFYFIHLIRIIYIELINQLIKDMFVNVWYHCAVWFFFTYVFD